MILVQYQLAFVALAFLAGCAATAAMLRQPAESRVWPLADLLWVVFGLVGALGALVAEMHTADSSRIARQVDLARAASAEFDRASGRFRLRHCDDPPGAALATLCDKADFLAASTAANADLPLFMTAAEQASPRRSLNLFADPHTAAGTAAAEARADAFDPGALLAFQPLDARTRPALKELQKTDPALAGEFRILARSYEALIREIDRLQREWAYLDARSWVLALQIAAICLVAFAVPFRLGRAIAALTRRGRAGDGWKGPDQFD